MIYPKLSIVVPTYNRKDYLKECLDSILNQNYPSLEIIITDDNSVDDTQKVANEYMQQYKYVKYVKNKKYKQGPTGNKNNGLDYVTGEIVGIFDDDDTLATNALISLVDQLLDGYDIVIGNCQIISDSKDNGYLSGTGIDISREIDYEHYICGKLRGEFFGIFKREKLNSMRFDDDLYGGEGTLWSQLYKNSKVYYIHKVVRYYRVHSNSVSLNLTKHAKRSVLNYEKDILLNGEAMKKLCPCWLSSVHKGAAYFAKLSNQYRKSISHLIKSLTLCFNKEAFILLFLMPIPNFVIMKIMALRSSVKRYFNKDVKLDKDITRCVE